MRDHSLIGPSVGQAARTDAHDILAGLFDLAMTQPDHADPILLSVAYSLIAISEDLAAIRQRLLETKA